MCFVGSNLYVLFEERERERERGGGFGSAQECGSFALKQDSLRICSQLQCGSLQRQIVEAREREREREAGGSATFVSLA
jgi:hypothetical protein